MREKLSAKQNKKKKKLKGLLKVRTQVSDLGPSLKLSPKLRKWTSQ